MTGFMGQYRDQRACTHTYTKHILCHWPYKIAGSEQWLMTGEMSRKRNYVLHLSVRMHLRSKQTDRSGLRLSGFMFLFIIWPLIIIFGVFEGCIAFECVCKLCLLVLGLFFMCKINSVKHEIMFFCHRSSDGWTVRMLCFLLALFLRPCLTSLLVRHGKFY